MSSPALSPLYGPRRARLLPRYSEADLSALCEQTRADQLGPLLRRLAQELRVHAGFGKLAPVADALIDVLFSEFGGQEAALFEPLPGFPQFHECARQALVELIDTPDHSRRLIGWNLGRGTLRQLARQTTPATNPAMSHYVEALAESTLRQPNSSSTPMLRSLMVGAENWGPAAARGALRTLAPFELEKLAALCELLGDTAEPIRVHAYSESTQTLIPEFARFREQGPKNARFSRLSLHITEHWRRAGARELAARLMLRSDDELRELFGLQPTCAIERLRAALPDLLAAAIAKKRPTPGKLRSLAEHATR